MDKEEARWKQRSCLSWLREGDRNTRYFHNHASKRHRKNWIISITDSSGQWVTNQQLINRSFLQYFQTLFTSADSTPYNNLSYGIQRHVTAAMNEILCQPFTADEIKTSLSQMHPSKAPSFDGLLALFFQSYWCTVGDTLTTACLHILNEGCDMGEINHTLIALVSKVNEL